MIIDGHAHIGQMDYVSLEKYLAALDAAGIDLGLVFPGGTMDVRQMTRYVTGELKSGPAIPNDLVQAAMRRYPNRIKGFVMVNPLTPDALEVFQTGVDNGCVGLKLNPMAHRFSFSSKVLDQLAERCAELHFPVYSHTLFDPGASSKKFAQFAQRHPGCNFIIGHLGFGPSDVDAFGLARDIPNLYLETSLGCLLAMEEALKTAGSQKIIFGSEYPMSSPAIELFKLRQLCETYPAAWEDISHRTIMRLIPALAAMGAAHASS